jgi:uncharacterized membrane protein YdjX (TVP38/TMEM64 family)
MDQSVSQDDAGPRRLPAWRRYGPLALLLVGLAAFFAFGLHRMFTFDMLRTHRVAMLQWVAEHRMLASLAYVLAYVVIVGFSLPVGTVATLAGGFLFGTMLGCGLTVVGATLGAIAVFWAARTAFADLLRARAGGFLKRMEEGFRKDAFSYLLFLRLVPAFPFWLVNIVPAFAGVPVRTYALATLIGVIPGTAVYSSVGAGLGAVFDMGKTPDLGMIFEPQVLLPLLGLAALSLLPILYKRFKGAGRPT